MYRLNNICQYSAWKLYLEPLKHTHSDLSPLSLPPFPSPPHHWSCHLIMQLPALGVRPTCTFVWVQEICACALDLVHVHLRAATRSWTTFKQRENVNNTRLLKQVWQRTIVSPLASMTTTFVYSPTILTNLEREKLKPGSRARIQNALSRNQAHSLIDKCWPQSQSLSLALFNKLSMSDSLISRLEASDQNGVRVLCVDSLLNLE